MAEVGQVLRRKREELGLSLEDIQTKTKIRKRYIEAIEAEDWNVLPGKVYARGFVRSYADALGLDGFQLLDQLDEQQEPSAENPSKNADSYDNDAGQNLNSSSNDISSDTKAEEMEQKGERLQHKPPVSDSKPSEKSPSTQPDMKNRMKDSIRAVRKPRRNGTGVPIGQIATVVIGLGILGGGWWVLYHRGNGASNTPGPNQSQITAPANTPSNTGQETSNTTVNNTTTPPPKPVLQVTSKPYDNKSGTQTYIVTAAKKLTVQMQAQPACWMRIIKLDNKSGNPSGQTVQPKQPKTWTASNLVYIRLGHVHGVSLSVNGKTVKLPNVNHPIDVQFKKSSKS